MLLCAVVVSWEETIFAVTFLSRIADVIIVDTHRIERNRYTVVIFTNKKYSACLNISCVLLFTSLALSSSAAAKSE